MPILSLPTVEYGDSVIEPSIEFLNALKSLLKEEVKMVMAQAPNEYDKITWARLTVGNLGDTFSYEVTYGVEGLYQPDDGGGQYAVIIDGVAFALEKTPEYFFNLEDTITEIIDLNLTLADLEAARVDGERQLYETRLMFIRKFMDDLGVKNYNEIGSTPEIRNMLVDYAILNLPDDHSLKIIADGLETLKAEIGKAKAALENAYLIKDYLEKRRAYLARQE